MIVFTDHAILKHLLKKSDSKTHFTRWVLLLQEFDVEIRDKARLENAMVDCLFHLGLEATLIEEVLLNDSFSDD